jgi:hypothetical protein
LHDLQRLGNDILRQAHPDSVSTLRHWLTTVQVRWNEVKNLSAQRSKRLKDGLEVAKATSRQLDNLMDWLGNIADILTGQNNQPVPENLPIVEQLLQTHTVRMRFKQFVYSWLIYCEILHPWQANL